MDSNSANTCRTPHVDTHVEVGARTVTRARDTTASPRASSSAAVRAAACKTFGGIVSSSSRPLVEVLARSSGEPCPQRVHGHIDAIEATRC